MPITQSAKKAIRVASRKRAFNVRRLNVMKDTIKKFNKLSEEKKIKEAEALLPTLYKAIDKAAKRGVIKQNTAARKKSRLTKALQEKKTKKEKK